MQNQLQLNYSMCNFIMIQTTQGDQAGVQEAELILGFALN
jgi:hypothetical protein